MKAKEIEKAEKNTVERIKVDMCKFAHVCEVAINEACVSGFEKGWTPTQMCDFEMRLWAAANIIGNKLFACDPKVDFSDGRMDKVRIELESGVWTPAEVADEDKRQI